MADDRGFAGPGDRVTARLGEGTNVLVLSGPVTPAELDALCARAGRWLESCTSEVVICDVGAVTDPDAATLDALARVQLTARRLGRRILLRGACQELRDLLSFAGLTDVVPCAPRLALEPGGQAEHGKEAGRVEEERDPDDPVT